MESRPTNFPEKVRRWLESLTLDCSSELFLLAHELVVNAVVHTDSDRLWLTLLVCPEVVHVQVANEGTRPPRVLHKPPFDESGRGLRWVDALSSSWGVGRTAATHVWFQVRRDPTSDDDAAPGPLRQV
jgi:hypothetical protein